MPHTSCFPLPGWGFRKSTQDLISEAVNSIKSYRRHSFPAPLSNYLHFHRIRVHLAHVLAAVLHLHALDHQRPCVLVAVRHRQPVIVRNHVLVDRQNGFRVRFNPGHLQQRAMDTMRRRRRREATTHNTARASWRKIDSWLFMSPCGKLDFNMYIYW